MQGLNLIHLPGQSSRHDGYAAREAARILYFDRRRYFTGSNILTTFLHRRTLEEGGFQARTRRGRVMASRVNQALRRNLERLDAASVLVDALKENVWYKGASQDFVEHHDRKGTSGRIGLEVASWIGRVCITIHGPVQDMVLSGGDGSRIPIRAPGLSVQLVDDAGCIGRCGLQSLTGDVEPLMDLMREALHNAQALVKSLRPS